MKRIFELKIVLEKNELLGTRVVFKPAIDEKTRKKLEPCLTRLQEKILQIYGQN